MNFNFVKPYSFYTDNLFLVNTEDLVTCKICLSIVKSPRQCKECENVCCEECLCKWEKGCPMRCQMKSSFSTCILQNSGLSDKFLSKPNKTFLLVYESIRLLCQDCLNVFDIENFYKHKECSKILNKKELNDYNILEVVMKRNEIIEQELKQLKKQVEALSSNNREINSLNEKKIKLVQPNPQIVTKLKIKNFYGGNNSNDMMNYSWMNCSYFNIKFHNCEHVDSTFVPIFKKCNMNFSCIDCHFNCGAEDCNGEIEKICCKRCFVIQDAWIYKYCINCCLPFTYNKI